MIASLIWSFLLGAIVSAFITRIGWGYELFGTWLDDLTRRFRGQG